MLIVHIGVFKCRIIIESLQVCEFCRYCILKDFKETGFGEILKLGVRLFGC